MSRMFEKNERAYVETVAVVGSDDDERVVAQVVLQRDVLADVVEEEV